jgi:hypothetical protein
VVALRKSNRAAAKEAGAAKRNFLTRLGTLLSDWTEVVGGQVLSKQGEKCRTEIRFVHYPHTPPGMISRSHHSVGVAGTAGRTEDQY